jgi:hypothetical protein
MGGRSGAFAEDVVGSIVLQRRNIIAENPSHAKQVYLLFLSNTVVVEPEEASDIEVGFRTSPPSANGADGVTPMFACNTVTGAIVPWDKTADCEVSAVLEITVAFDVAAITTPLTKILTPDNCRPNCTNLNPVFILATLLTSLSNVPKLPESLSPSA